MVFVVITFGPGSNKINEKMVRKPTFLRSQPERMTKKLHQTRQKQKKWFLRMQRNDRQVCSHICTLMTTKKKSQQSAMLFNFPFHRMNFMCKYPLPFFLWNLIAYFVHIFVLTETNLMLLLLLLWWRFGLAHFVFVSLNISGLNN